MVFERVDRPPRRRVRDFEIDVAAPVRCKPVNRQRRALLKCERRAVETHCSLPAWAGELQRVAGGVNFHRAVRRKYALLRQVVEVGVFPVEFHPAPAVLGGENGTHFLRFEHPLGGAVTIEIGTRQWTSAPSRWKIGWGFTARKI